MAVLLEAFMMLILTPIFAVLALICQLLFSLIIVFPVFWMYEYIQPTFNTPVLTVWHVFCIYNIVRFLLPIHSQTKLNKK